MTTVQKRKTITNSKPKQRSRSDFFQKLKMLPNVLPLEASLSSMDIFERSPVLITFDTFDSSFEQKIGPIHSPNGPTLAFEVVGDRNNFLELQKISMEMKCKFTQTDGTVLRYDARSAAKSNNPFFVINTLHSLFSECTVTANGIKISNSTGVYAHKAFIETEYSSGKEAKDTWLRCQGYTYEETLETVRRLSLQAEEQKPENPRKLHFLVKLQQTSFLVTNTCSVV